MAANFNPLYTGRDSNVKLPELDSMERSIARNAQNTVRGEEMKLEKSLRDKEAFLKMMKVDPVLAISKTNQTAQALLLTKYNNKWGAREQQAANKGGLSIADQLEQQTDKGEITSFQNKVINDQEQLKEMTSAVRRDTRGYWDHTKFENDLVAYRETGELPILDVAPQDITSALSSYKAVGNPTAPHIEINDVRDSGGRVTKWKTEYSTLRNEDEAKQLIPQLAMSNEAYLKDLIRKFDNAPQDEQLKYLKDYDKNKNGIIDPTERQNAFEGINVNHPIFEWAKNNPLILKAAMGAQPTGKSTEVKEPRPTGGTGLPINIGGADLKVSPAVKRTSAVQYGDKSYVDTYAFAGNTTLSNLPTLGGLRFRGTSSRELKKGNITGKLKDYVADDDMIIIEAATGIPELDIETKGLVAIPANSIQGADNLPITVDGKTTTLGTLRGQKGSTQTAPKKKSFNSVTGKFE